MPNFETFFVNVLKSISIFYHSKNSFFWMPSNYSEQSFSSFLQSIYFNYFPALIGSISYHKNLDNLEMIDPKLIKL